MLAGIGGDGDAVERQAAPRRFGEVLAEKTGHPGRTTSSGPLTGKAATGVPQALASAMTIP